MPLGRSLPGLIAFDARGQGRVDNESFTQMAENLGLCGEIVSYQLDVGIS
jgi:hypothetical protein